MKNILRSLTGVLTTAIIMGCATENTELYSPVPTPDVVSGSQVFKAGSATINNQVDILFVIDNSTSMKKHISNLSNNIDKFVNEFTQRDKGAIDFRIGVTSVWDTVKFEDQMQGLLGDQSIRKPFGKGQLRPLKNQQGEILEDHPPYVTASTPQAIEVLRNTLKIGVENHACNKGTGYYNQHTGLFVESLNQSHTNIFETLSNEEKSEYVKNNCGPENEEVFSPIVEMVNNESLLRRDNAHFPSKEADQLVVMLITDAEDDIRAQANGGNGFTASETAQSLRQFMKRKESTAVSAYGVLNTKCSQQAKDPGSVLEVHPRTQQLYEKVLRPDAERLEKFVSHFDGQVMSICQANFGKGLAQFARDIREKTLERKKTIVELGAIPAEGTLKVYINEKELAYDAQRNGKGWGYDSAMSIYIGENVPMDTTKGVEVTWTFEGVLPQQPAESAY